MEMMRSKWRVGQVMSLISSFLFGVFVISFSVKPISAGERITEQTDLLRLVLCRDAKLEVQSKPIS